jgi:hypothetical protein
MKTYWGMLTSALDWGEWPASHPCRVTTGETAPLPFCRRRSGLQTRSSSLVEEENSLPLPGTESRFLGHPAHSRRYTDWAIAANVTIRNSSKRELQDWGYECKKGFVPPQNKNRCVAWWQRYKKRRRDFHLASQQTRKREEARQEM